MPPYTAATSGPHIFFSIRPMSTVLMTTWPSQSERASSTKKDPTIGSISTTTFSSHSHSQSIPVSATLPSVVAGQTVPPSSVNTAAPVAASGVTMQVPDESGNHKKKTRGARACMVCRRLKMRCVPRTENGVEVEPPCKRCFSGNKECIFEESQRGKRNKKQDVMASSILKMEQTLDVVLKSINHPGVLASSGGMITTSPLKSLNMSPAVNADNNLPLTLDPRLITEDTSIYSPALQGRPLTRISTAGTTSSLRNQENIETPSPRLHSLPDNTLNPLGLLAEASLRNSLRLLNNQANIIDPDISSTQSNDIPLVEEETTKDVAVPDDKAEKSRKPVGLASKTYFLPSVMNILPLRRFMIEARRQPTILADKIVTMEEAILLFKIYFENVSIHNTILDPGFHTPAVVGARSSFLFSTICAIASRFYTERKDLYSKCQAAAKNTAFEVLNKGWKSVEIVQAFTLLSLWNQPAERFEEDRTWTFLGIALRMATDLNLHRKSLAQLPEDADEQAKIQFEKEILNRERTWLALWIQDRSLSFQMGKPYSIPREDFIVRNSRYWHEQRSSSEYDGGIVAMVQMHRINQRILDTIYSDTTTPSGLNHHIDYNVLVRTFAMQIDAWRDEWKIKVTANDKRSEYSAAMCEFYYHYYKLLLYSFAFQNALEKRDLNDDSTDLNGMFLLCFENASSIIRTARETLGPKKFLRFANDAQFVFLSYAAVFLLKCLRHDLTSICPEITILNLIQDVIDVLEDVAVDETHTPAIYGRFLQMLLDGRKANGKTDAIQDGSASQDALQDRQNALGINIMDPVSGEGVEGDEISSSSKSNEMEVDNMDLVGNSNLSMPSLGYLGAEIESILGDHGMWNTFLFPGFGAQFELSACGGAFTNQSVGSTTWDFGTLNSLEDGWNVDTGELVDADGALPSSWT